MSKGSGCSEIFLSVTYINVAQDRKGILLICLLSFEGSKIRKYCSGGVPGFFFEWCKLIKISNNITNITY